jgi:galactokinase
MTGGGFGGTVIGLLDTHLAQPASDAVLRAFEISGYQQPKALIVHPSRGAFRALS